MMSKTKKGQMSKIYNTHKSMWKDNNPPKKIIEKKHWQPVQEEIFRNISN